jgi:hypothetical protein
MSDLDLHLSRVTWIAQLKMWAAFSHLLSLLLALGKFGLVSRQSIFICGKTVALVPLHRGKTKTSSGQQEAT